MPVLNEKLIKRADALKKQLLRKNNRCVEVITMK